MSLDKSLAEQINKLLQIEGDKLLKEMSDQFQKEFERRTKSLVSEAVMEIFRVVSFHRSSQELVITVKIPEVTK